MFSYIRHQSPPSPDGDMDMDNSYIRELHHRQSTIESKPFDEQSFSEEYVYLDTLATGGSDASGIVNKASSDCASKSKNGSLTGNYQSMKDLGAGHTSSTDEHSNDESRNPSLGSGSGNMTNTPMSDRSKNLDAVSMLSYSSLSDNVSANSNPSSRSAPSALSGGHQSVRSGQSRCTDNASANSNLSARSTPSALSGGNQSARSGRSSEASAPSTTNMTGKQADEAYRKICCENRYDASTTASSPERSTLSGKHAQGRARADTITTAGSATSSFAASHTTKTATPTSSSDASAKNGDPIVVTLAYMPSRSKSFPVAIKDETVLSFGNDSQYSAAGTVEDASALASDEIQEADNELDNQVDNEVDVMDKGLKKLEKKKELRAKMLEQEKQKEEQDDIVKGKIGNGQIVKVALGRPGDEGESGRGVMLAKLMTRSGTLDKMPPQGDGPQEQRGVAAQGDTFDRKVTLDKIKEEVLDGPKEQAPMKEDTSKREEPEQAQCKPKKRAQNQPAVLKFTSHSHSSRGTFSFAKLKSKNLKSKRFFGKKKAFANVEPRPVKIMPAHIKELQGKSEVELTYGSVHSFPRTPHPKSTTSDGATDASDQPSTAPTGIKPISSPNKSTSNSTDTTDKATYLPEVMKRSDSSNTDGTKNIAPSSTSMKEMTKDAIEIPRVESNHTNDTESITIASKEGQEMGHVPLKADANNAGNDFSETQTTHSGNINTGGTSSHKCIYPISFFNQLFACGAAPLECNTRASITSNKGDKASQSVATGASPILLFDDNVDEALNVEVYDDDNNVTHIGALGEVSRAPKDIPSGPEVCRDSQYNSENNSNDAETEATSKVILKTHLVPSFEVISKEGGDDIIVDSASMKIGEIAQKMEKRREKEHLGGVGTLKGKKNALRMKLLKKLKKGGKPATSAVAAVAPSL